MTLQQFINSGYDIYYFMSGGLEYIVRNHSPQGCRHVDGFVKYGGTWDYSKHTCIRDDSLKPQYKKKFMIPTQETLIKTYKEFPELRQYTISLFGNFLDPKTKEVIDQEDEIIKLKRELAECKYKEGVQEIIRSNS